jgi:hypothetical protein
MAEIKNVQILQWEGGGDVYVAVNNAIIFCLPQGQGEALMREVVDLCRMVEKNKVSAL